MTQALSVAAASLYPVNVAINNTTNNSTVGPVNMSKFKRILGHAIAGTLGANINVTMVFQSSNANNGTFTNVPSGPSVVLNTVNSEGTIEMRADQVPAGNSWVQMLLFSNTNTNVNNNTLIVGSIYGGEPGYRPASQFDYTTNVSLLNRAVM